MSLRRENPPELPSLSEFGFAYSGSLFFKFVSMNIKLMRPLIFFDLETTGLSIAKDRICQLSFTKFFPDKDPEVKTKIINPTIPIPLESSKVHNIYDKDVKNAPKFIQFAESLAEQFEGCDIAGYNIINFDIPLMREEFLRAGVDWPKVDVRFVDVYKLVALALPRKLSQVFEMFTDNDADQAHDAEYDNMMTVEVMDRLLNPKAIKISAHSDLFKDKTVEYLSELCKSDDNYADFAMKIAIDRAGEYVFNFGKHKGEKVTNYKGFCKWMLLQDFTEDTKNVIMKIFGAKTPDQI